MNTKQKSVDNFVKLACLYPVFFVSVAVFFSILVVVDLPGLLETVTYFLPYASFVLAAFLFSKLKNRKQKRSIGSNEVRIIKFVFFASTLSLFFQYKSLFGEYGSAEQILLSAFDIRQELIGQSVSIFPWWIGYLFGFSYFGLALLLSTEIISGWRKFILVVTLFLMIFFYDLATFGRVGTIFSIFILVSHILLAKGMMAFLKIRFIFLMFILFLLSSLARLLRGSFDNFEGSIDFKIRFIDSFGIFNGILVAMKYFTESFFAFSKKINTDFEYEFGGRNFIVINNFISKFNDGFYKNRIDDMVAIPFDANIYGIQWDLYLDFGIWGLVIFPFVWAGVIIYFLKSNSCMDRSIGLLLTAGYLFWPIFNIYTFGGMLIALAIAMLFSFIEKLRIK